jgi:hypothetical protein
MATLTAILGSTQRSAGLAPVFRAAARQRCENPHQTIEHVRVVGRGFCAFDQDAKPALVGPQSGGELRSGDQGWSQTGLQSRTRPSPFRAVWLDPANLGDSIRYRKTRSPCRHVTHVGKLASTSGHAIREG